MPDREVNKVLNVCYVLPVSGPHTDVRTTARICKVGSTVYLSTKMLMNFSRNSYNAKGKVGCPEGMSYLLSLFLKFSYLICVK